MDNIYGYTYSGFTTLQQFTDQYIFYIANGATFDTALLSSVSMMPTAAYRTDNFQYVIAQTLGECTVWEDL